jgi:hypothetical protein
MSFSRFIQILSEEAHAARLRLGEFRYLPPLLALPSPAVDGALFSPGRFWITSGAITSLRCYPDLLPKLLERHLHGDCGEADADQQAQNERSLEHGYGQIQSLYSTPGGQTILVSSVCGSLDSFTVVALPGE